MNIMLGNLSVQQIEERTGVQFPEDIRALMNGSRQMAAANIKPGRWHCFDIPFCLVCGGMDLAVTIYDSVKDKSAEFKENLEIAVQNNV